MSYSVGEAVSGVVCGVTDYGAFVRLEDGSNGMIHISKISSGFVSDIRSVIKKGEKVTATVISTNDGKIALSLIGDSPRAVKQNRKSCSDDFESMLSAFKTASDERLAGMSSRDKKKRR